MAAVAREAYLRRRHEREVDPAPCRQRSDRPAESVRKGDLSRLHSRAPKPVAGVMTDDSGQRTKSVKGPRGLGAKQYTVTLTREEWLEKQPEDYRRRLLKDEDSADLQEKAS